jgi:AcrR family transcriptional regulator
VRSCAAAETIGPLKDVIVPARGGKQTAGKTRKRVNLPVIPETVLEEAARMFLEQGYYRTRMQDIADSFGVTHAALYYHFRNKQDILAQINVRAIRKLLDGAESILATEMPPTEKFLALIRQHMEYVATNPAFVGTFLEHDLEIPPAHLARITRMRRAYTQILIDLYEEARADGSVPAIDSKVAVSLLLGACNWIYRWYEPDRALSPEQLVEQGMILLSRIAVG